MKKYELEGNVTMVTNAAGKVAQHVGYYPYGEPWREPSGQPYLFGGKERMRDGALNEYDFGTRRYNPALALWTTPDPVVHDQYSPYTYCAGNPIRYIDPNGMEFTEQSYKYLNKYINVVNKNITSLEKKIKKLNDGVSAKNAKSLEKKIKKLEDKKAQFTQILTEIDRLTESSQVYDIVKDTQHNETADNNGMGATTRSGSYFDTESDIFVIFLGDDNIKILAHELTHAFQFETGEFSSGHMKNGTPFYDLNDEIQAYQRAALFGEPFNEYQITKRYYYLQEGPWGVSRMDLKEEYEQNTLQQLAEKYRCAFRWKGILYKY